MIDLDKFLWGFSIIFFLQDLFQVFRKAISMALGYNTSSSPPSWSSPRSSTFIPKGITVASKDHPIDNSLGKTILVDCMAPNSPVPMSNGLNITRVEDSSKENLCSEMFLQENSCYESNMKRKLVFDEMCLKSKDYLEENFDYEKYPKENSGILVQEGLMSVENIMMKDIKESRKLRKRPAKLILPSESCSSLNFGEELGQKEFEVEGRDFVLASKRGRRGVMEDNYGIITDIIGDPKQAFFGVFDGHGGRAAVDYVSENLGKNILTALTQAEKAGDQLEKAIRDGYLITDQEFLSKEISSGACVATVILKDGELYAANVGDCRVVLSRNGLANALTSDHHVNREDERFRIENLGAYVNCQNGVWRVQGSLAVSRAIGDLHLKEWIISEPEINKLRLTPDCEFLVIASDGLWDKVTNQEAVDVISKHKNSIESCKKLVEISSSRGNRDDVTVMVVDLQNFKT